MIATILPLIFSRAGATVIGGVVLLGALALFIHHRETAAVERAAQKIETQDRSAVDAAVEARSKRWECTGPGSDARNHWDVSRGVCERP